MGIAQQTILRPVQGEVRSHDVTIMLGYAAFANDLREKTAKLQAVCWISQLWSG
jgi:hypothetical protein